MQQGAQDLSLMISDQISCLFPYIVAHEFMHALGFEHEHARPDRDKFIIFHYENLIDGNFRKYNN